MLQNKRNWWECANFWFLGFSLILTFFGSVIFPIWGFSGFACFSFTDFSVSVICISNLELFRFTEFPKNH